MAKVKLSNTAIGALVMLANNPDLRICTLRRGEGKEWYARVSYTDRVAVNVTVPVPVFRRLVTLGLVAYEASHVVSTSQYDGDLISTRYALTEAGQAALESEAA